MADEHIYDEEEIRKKFEALPADIKDLVFSADMLNTLQQVGSKHQLHVDQIGSLEAVTADVMSGFTKPEEFAPNIASSLNIDQKKAEAVAHDISEQLFVKIRESLKKLYEQGGADTNQIKSPVAAQASSATTTSATPKPVASVPQLTKPAQQATPTSIPSAPASKPPTAPPPLRSTSVSAPHPPTTPPKPQVPMAPHPHDLTLVEKTVTTPAKTHDTATPSAPPAPETANKDPQKPTNYKSDPYREPIEP